MSRLRILLALPLSLAGKLHLHGVDSSIEMGGATLRASCQRDVTPGILYMSPSNGGQNTLFWPFEDVITRVHSVHPACSAVPSVSTPCAADEDVAPRLWRCHWSGMSGSNVEFTTGPVHAVADAVMTNMVTLAIRTTVSCPAPARYQLFEESNVSGQRNLTLALSYAGQDVGYEGIVGGDVVTFILENDCGAQATMLDRQKDYSIVVCHNQHSCEQHKGNDCPRGYHLCTYLEWNHYNDGEWWDDGVSSQSIAIGANVCRANMQSSGHLQINNGRGDVENNEFSGSIRPTGNCDTLDHGCTPWEKTLPAACCIDSPKCGDGVVNPILEECDDGNDVDGDGCDNDCKWTIIRNFCRAGERLDRQKDNTIILCRNTESCEQFKGDDCPHGHHLCTYLEWNHYNDGEWYDSEAPANSYAAIGANVCRANMQSSGHLQINNGRGDVENNEFLGSIRPTGNCDTNDYGCDEKTYTAACCIDSPKCGDGVVNPILEECDDKNKVDGDGCDNDCKRTVFVPST